MKSVKALLCFLVLASFCASACTRPPAAPQRQVDRELLKDLPFLASDTPADRTPAQTEADTDKCFIEPSASTIERIKTETRALEKRTGKYSRSETWRGIRLNGLPTKQVEFLNTLEPFIRDFQEFESFSPCTSAACVSRAILKKVRADGEQDGSNERDAWFSYLWFLKTGSHIVQVPRVHPKMSAGIESVTNELAKSVIEAYRDVPLANARVLDRLQMDRLIHFLSLSPGAAYEPFPKKLLSFQNTINAPRFAGANIHKDNKLAVFIKPDSAFRSLYNYARSISDRDIAWVDDPGTFNTFHELGHTRAFSQSPNETSNEAWHSLGGWKWVSVTNPETGKITSGEYVQITGGPPEEPPTSYAAISPDEDFAESFGLFHLMPMSLKEMAPKRYEYMRTQILKNWESDLTLPKLTERFLSKLKTELIVGLARCSSAPETLPSQDAPQLPDAWEEIMLKQGDFVQGPQELREDWNRLSSCANIALRNAVKTLVDRLRREEVTGCLVFKSRTDSPVYTAAAAPVGKILKNWIVSAPGFGDTFVAFQEWSKALSESLPLTQIMITHLKANGLDKDGADRQLRSEIARVGEPYRRRVGSWWTSGVEIFAGNIDIDQVAQLRSELSLEDRAHEAVESCYRLPQNPQDPLVTEPYSGGDQYASKTFLKCINEAISTDLRNYPHDTLGKILGFAPPPGAVEWAREVLLEKWKSDIGYRIQALKNDENPKVSNFRSSIPADIERWLQGRLEDLHPTVMPEIERCTAVVQSRFGRQMRTAWDALHLHFQPESTFLAVQSDGAASFCRSIQKKRRALSPRKGK